MVVGGHEDQTVLVGMGIRRGDLALLIYLVWIRLWRLYGGLAGWGGRK